MCLDPGQAELTLRRGFQSTDRCIGLRLVADVSIEIAVGDRVEQAGQPEQNDEGRLAPGVPKYQVFRRLSSRHALSVDCVSTQRQIITRNPRPCLRQPDRFALLLRFQAGLEDLDGERYSRNTRPTRRVGTISSPTTPGFCEMSRTRCSSEGWQRTNSRRRTIGLSSSTYANHGEWRGSS